ncbi:MAG: hypothetical protein JO131_04830 [Gammaproteobacteria bacterium]|nr:hypothetical protein [Gammaproteobacteria bacterium]
MLIETGNNNTQFLLNCTMDLVNSINESCDGDKKLLAFVIAVFAVAILACLCGCVARYTCGTLQLTNSETESTELAPRLTRSSALPNSANQPETNTSVSNLEVVSGLTKLSILSHSNNQPGEEITPNPRNTPDTEKNETSNNQPYERNDIRLYT